MFKKIIVLATFILANTFLIEAKYVRFAVNMQNSGLVSSNDVYMTSTFQSEIGMGGDMTNGQLHLTQSSTDTNVYYSPIYNIPAFAAYEYQFVMGDTGYDLENIPTESQSPLNGFRWLYVDSTSNDTLLMPAVYYSGNNSKTDSMYRFRVNISNETVSPNGIHIAGDFQGNNPATTRMYSFGNGIYEYMAWLTPATMVHYKFYNGNTAANTETVPSSCAMGGFRMITSVGAAQVLPIVCFNSCTNCTPASVASIEPISTVKFAPNPMTQSTLITFNDDAIWHQLSIHDLYGRTIRKMENIHTNSIQLNREALSSGCYFISILNDRNEQSRLKLIVD